MTETIDAAFRHLAVRVCGGDGLVRGRIAAIFQMMLDMHVSAPIIPQMPKFYHITYPK